MDHARIKLQTKLDASKTQAERNRLGQFATPAALARDILTYALRLFPSDEKVCFLDPAIGTGAFYSALLNVFPKARIEKTLGFEIDPYYGKPADELWQKTGLVLKLVDFTQEEPSDRFNLVICNPPYVRHHHLRNEEKVRLQKRTLSSSGIQVNGLAGLYCHFLGMSHAWMKEGGIAGWLIPSEFMDVNYGRAVKRYLLECVTLLHIHRFDPDEVQFEDALVSSTVVWFRNSRPPADHSVVFSLGGSLIEPRISREIPVRELSCDLKWTHLPTASATATTSTIKLSHFFRITRGLATGDNRFFILKEDDLERRSLPRELFKPILPSPRYLPVDEVQSDSDGYPLLEKRQFLLDTRLSEEEIKNRFPTLWSYLKEGMSDGLHERYLCRHRSPWYSQENRPPAPISCTYIGRGKKPFRFILNESNATVANVYLAMYLTPILDRAMKQDKLLIRRIWQILNTLTDEQFLNEGRVYGGGMYKLEPRELANVDASALLELIPDIKLVPTSRQLSLSFAP